ncbi:hypothetical protein EHQ81_19350 [Leptospira selangorensis]|uniref:Uncharacterized protein n=1 Tax=Leptospira selangorensis TaxID=2484982 RepID=A0A5F2C7K5_9LEPT|nr:hypothetical protein [Leptospira selangorensis]TGM10266.1 hypothetical protein EHQ81_19350 [Leptospira selangorensis]TGM27927.1 hypothetical protein EHQ82_01525 [Leptospira selangorensis]
MLNDLLLQAIGKNLYEAAKRSIHERKIANTDFIHDIDYLMVGLNFQHDEIWRTWQSLITEIPCYATWMYVHLYYKNHLQNHEKKDFHSKIASLIDNNDSVIVEAIKYALWVDFFEDADTVVNAWIDINKGISFLHSKVTLISVSGPVPYVLKKELYESFLLLPAEFRHLENALYACCTDVYGQIDCEHALFLLTEIRRIKPEFSTKSLEDILKLRNCV